MAQHEQESRNEWLKENTLHFMKDALVEEGYTLKMGTDLDMTDKDIDDIIDAQNMAKLKRPRFRNAVERLKEKPQASNNGSQRIKNVYVIISAIEDYSQSKLNGKI